MRKIGRITLRNIIDLNRNIENAFKSEPNYKIKIVRLESFDQKRKDIQQLIEQTERMILGEEEQTFFKTAMDDELKYITSQLRLKLTEARHNLIETQKQVIEFLNQVKFQSRLVEKIKQVKYLKDQFELKAKPIWLKYYKKAML
jgi:mevalonate pyrophosphate decarboxylase